MDAPLITDKYDIKMNDIRNDYSLYPENGSSKREPASLKKGQLVTGTIVAVEDKITIAINGSNVTAQKNIFGNVQPGDVKTFEVVKVSDRVIELALYEKNEAGRRSFNASIESYPNWDLLMSQKEPTAKKVFKETEYKELAAKLADIGARLTEQDYSRLEMEGFPVYELTVSGLYEALDRIKEAEGIEKAVHVKYGKEDFVNKASAVDKVSLTDKNSRYDNVNKENTARTEDRTGTANTRSSEYKSGNANTRNSEENTGMTNERSSEDRTGMANERSSEDRTGMANTRSSEYRAGMANERSSKNKTGMVNTRSSEDKTGMVNTRSSEDRANMANTKSSIYKTFIDNSRSEEDKAGIDNTGRKYIKTSLINKGNKEYNSHILNKGNKEYRLFKENTARIESLAEENKAAIKSYTSSDIQESKRNTVNIEDLAKLLNKASIEEKLKEENIPATAENVERLLKALSLSKAASALDDKAMKYLIKNEAEPTIENIYKAQYSGSSMSSPLSDKQWEELINQASEIIAEAGFEVTEENLQTAKWLVDNQIPLTKETFSYRKELEDIKVNSSYELVFSKIIDGMRKGINPKDVKLSSDKDYTPKQLIEDIAYIKQEAISQAVKSDEELTISRLVKIQKKLNTNPEEIFKSKPSENGNQTEARIDEPTSRKVENKTDNKAYDVGMAAEVKPAENEHGNVVAEAIDENQYKEVKARRQLEEIRLKMTLDTATALQRKGIKVETLELTRVVEALRELENSYYTRLFKEADVQAANADINLLKETTNSVEQLKTIPAHVLGSTLAARFTQTIPQLIEEGKKLTPALEKAGAAYEALMTVPNREYGDSIQKAFDNMSSLLDELGIENTEQNQRAVRILAYNRMEINEESIRQVKAYDLQVNEVIKNLHPAVTVRMIKEGINPLDIPIYKLNKEIDELKKEQGITDEEKYSTFLHKLEKANGITESERKAYIGIYRLLYNVVKSDGAAIGAVLKTGREVTLDNLLTAVATGRRGRLDARVNDSFGMLQDVRRDREAISAQLSLFKADEGRQAAEQEMLNYSTEQILRNFDPAATEQNLSDFNPAATEQIQIDFDPVAAAQNQIDFRPIATKQNRENLDPIAIEQKQADFSSTASERLRRDYNPVVTEKKQINLNQTATGQKRTDYYPAATEQVQGKFNPTTTEQGQINFEQEQITINSSDEQTKQGQANPTDIQGRVNPADEQLDYFNRIIKLLKDEASPESIGRRLQAARTYKQTVKSEGAAIYNAYPGHITDSSEELWELIKDIPVEKLYEQQVNEQPTERGAEEAYQEAVNKIRLLCKNAEQSIRFLKDYSIPGTPVNLIMAGQLLSNGESPFKRLIKLQQEKNDLKLDNSIKEIKNLSDKLVDKQTMEEAYTQLEDSVKQTLEVVCAEEETDSITIDRYISLQQQLKFLRKLAGKEFYQIPVITDRGITNVNLTIIRKAQSFGELTVMTSSDKLGNIKAELALKADTVTGYISCDKQEGLNKLKSYSGELDKTADESSLHIGKLDYVLIKKNAVVSNNREPANEDRIEKNPETERILYGLAKSLLRVVSLAEGD